MAGLGLAAAGGVKAGSDALVDLLKQKFTEQLQLRQQQAQEDQLRQQMAEHAASRGLQEREFGLAQETQRGTLKRQEAADKQAAQDRAAARDLTDESRFLGRLKILPKGAVIPTGEAGDFAKYGASALLKPRTRMPQRDASFVGPDQPEETGDFEFQGTQDTANAEERTRTQRDIADARNEAALARVQAAAANRPQPLVTIQTVDANGNPVTRIVTKTAGSEFVKPANATTATRVASAKAVNEVGNDVIAKLSDPKFAATVGPVMGRAGTLRDFIGNPPPEFSELAGQIESYALANMGVHGMRSAQGAEQIKKLLDQRHTPASLAATIRGLNDFSTRFETNNTPKSGGAPVATTTKAEQRPIPGIPGGMAELRNGKWIRVK
jgi:hypothetical protein